jgi:predicted phosphodiesterase
VIEADSARRQEADRHRLSRRTAWWTARLLLAAVGALLGVLLFGRVEAPIGPFDATVAFRPVGGDARVEIPPLGALTLDVYDGPLQLDVQLRQVNEQDARALANNPSLLEGIVDEVTADLDTAVTQLAWKTAVAAVGGAAFTALLALRRPPEALTAAALSGLLVLGTAALGVASWRPEALTKPTYSGLLVNTNSLIGRAEDIAARFDAYRDLLGQLVVNVSRLYASLAALPASPPGATDPVALLHVSDLHLNPAGFDLMREVVSQFDVAAVLDTGDITDLGSRPENRMIESLGNLGVPYVYVRGNHDSAVTADLVASQPNATVLDDSAVTIADITIVGTPDPRFTPDKDAAGPDESLEESGEELAAFAEELPEPAAIAMVHHPEQAGPLDGVVPLVLAGHMHKRSTSIMEDGTRLMIQGSTGGAGLRGLQNDNPTPLICTVLYFDPSAQRLTGYDDITLGGLGRTEVTIQRTVLDSDDEAASGSAPADGGTSGPADRAQTEDSGSESVGPPSGD